MKKILIIYTSAGDGHKKAAEAIYHDFLGLKRLDVEPLIIDSLSYTSRFFKYAYKIGYMVMIRYLPTLWGLFYHMLDNRFIFLLVRPFRHAINILNTRRLARFIVSERFDMAISTHFLPTYIIGHLKKRGIVSLPLINIVTDFIAHRYWQVKGVDRYMVASAMTRDMLIDRGTSGQVIDVSGIPVRPGFKEHTAKVQARRDIDAYPDKFTILVMGGGFGEGPIRDTVLILQKLDIDCQIIVVCGHNRKLYRRLKRYSGRFDKPTHIFSFTTNIDKLMSASDLIITKAGGLTISEALSKLLPVITIDPIPGQEAHNASFLSRNDLGFRLNGVRELRNTIEELHRDQRKIEALIQNIKAIAKPDAAGYITAFAIDMLRHSEER